MNIRRASEKDIPQIKKLLDQVNAVHHEGRPDLFRLGRKYDDGELKDILQDDRRPVFVAADSSDTAVGYAFCVLQKHGGSHILEPVTTLYIDDLCVDKDCRGQHIGTELYRHVLDFAREKGCHNLTLNVWSCNPEAMRFYERCGLTPQKVCMEQII